MDRVVVLGLTGFGNAVLRSLLGSGIKPIAVVTRQESFPHPYYVERSIEEEAEAHGVKVLYGADGESYIRDTRPEILLMCTYHRILKPEIYSHCRYAINFHPSLLPRYKGASPIYWVIRNGESITGVTAHLVSESADDGDLVAQVAVPIGEFETQGTLRQKLAIAAGDLVLDVLQLIKNDSIKCFPQDLAISSAHPKVDRTIREIDPSWPKNELQRHLRALSPFPGALLSEKNDQRVYFQQ